MPVPGSQLSVSSAEDSDESTIAAADTVSRFLLKCFDHDIFGAFAPQNPKYPADGIVICFA